MAVLLLGFVVPLQLIASVLSFLARDTVAGTALGLFGHQLERIEHEAGVRQQL